MAKIIESIIQYGNRDFDCWLLNEEVCITVELNSKCPSKNNVYTGNMWGYSWKPLVFERNVLYG